MVPGRQAWIVVPHFLWREGGSRPADGSGTPRQFAGRDVEGIAWSPDGRRIAYTERVDDDGDGSRDRYELRIATADGSGEPNPDRSRWQTDQNAWARDVSSSDPEQMDGVVVRRRHTPRAFNVPVYVTQTRSSDQRVTYPFRRVVGSVVRRRREGLHADNKRSHNRMVPGWRARRPQRTWSITIGTPKVRAELVVGCPNRTVPEPENLPTAAGWRAGHRAVPTSRSACRPMPVTTGSADRVEVWIVDVAGGGPPLAGQQRRTRLHIPFLFQPGLVTLRNANAPGSTSRAAPHVTASPGRIGHLDHRRWQTYVCSAKRWHSRMLGNR